MYTKFLTIILEKVNYIGDEKCDYDSLFSDGRRKLGESRKSI